MLTQITKLSNGTHIQLEFTNSGGTILGGGLLVMQQRADEVELMVKILCRWVGIVSPDDEKKHLKLRFDAVSASLKSYIDRVSTDGDRIAELNRALEHCSKQSKERKERIKELEANKREFLFNKEQFDEMVEQLKKWQTIANSQAMRIKELERERSENGTSFGEKEVCFIEKTMDGSWDTKIVTYRGLFDMYREEQNKYKDLKEQHEILLKVKGEIQVKHDKLLNQPTGIINQIDREFLQQEYDKLKTKYDDLLKKTEIALNVSLSAASITNGIQESEINNLKSKIEFLTKEFDRVSVEKAKIEVEYKDNTEKHVAYFQKEINKLKFNLRQQVSQFEYERDEKKKAQSELFRQVDENSIFKDQLESEKKILIDAWEADVKEIKKGKEKLNNQIEVLAKDKTKWFKKYHKLYDKINDLVENALRNGPGYVWLNKIKELLND